MPTGERLEGREPLDDVAASLVNAWVADKYAYDAEASSYVGTVTSDIANESVVRVTVDVDLDDEARLIGPLSMPSPIPAIPAIPASTGVQGCPVSGSTRNPSLTRSSSRRNTISAYSTGGRMRS